MENRSCRHRSLGMTLLELMITVTVVAILIGLAVPSFRYVTNSNRIAGEANNLLGDLQYARSEAIKEGQFVTLCVSTNVTASTPSCATGTVSTWTTGWIVFSDPNGDGIVNSGELVMRAANPFTSSDTFTATSNLKKITFNREGFAAGLSGVQYFTLHAPTSGNDWTRCVTVSTVGQTAVVKYNGGTCT